MLNNELVISRLSDVITGLGSDPMPCLIEGLIPDPALVMVHAVAKTGKTRLVTQLVLALASGTPFLERHVDSIRKVCYFDLELGATMFAYRLRDAEISLDGVEEQFWISDSRLWLSDSQCIQSLKELIVAEEISVAIIDSLSQTHGSNENHSHEMLPIVCGLKEIVSETRCSVFVVHHQGKRNENSGNGPQSFRGSSVLLDVVDTSIGLYKESEDHLRVEVTSRYFPSETLYLKDTGKEFVLVDGAPSKERRSENLDAAILDYLMGKGEVRRPEVAKVLAKELGISAKTVIREIEDLATKGRIQAYRTGNTYTVELVDRQTNA
jgi:RecA-family ATPase